MYSKIDYLSALWYNEVAMLMNNENLIIKEENRLAIFNHNYSSFIINYSFDEWHLNLISLV